MSTGMHHQRLFKASSICIAQMHCENNGSNRTFCWHFCLPVCQVPIQKVKAVNNPYLSVPCSMHSIAVVTQEQLQHFVVVCFVCLMFACESQRVLRIAAAGKVGGVNRLHRCQLHSPEDTRFSYGITVHSLWEPTAPA